MSCFSCNCRCRCPVAAIVVAVILGVVAAFLQITGTITVTAAFLWTVFGIGVVYLGVLAATATRSTTTSACVCPSLSTLLVGIVGTILFAVILLGVGIVATSVVSAVLVGVLVGFFFLMISATACLVRCLADCSCA